MEQWIQTIGVIAGIVLPLWNIPLIARINPRTSSQDISLWWVMGVWVCIVLMAPSGFTSTDIVWRTFNYMNVLFFTLVMVCVLAYRKPRESQDQTVS